MSEIDLLLILSFPQVTSSHVGFATASFFRMGNLFENLRFLKVIQVERLGLLLGGAREGEAGEVHWIREHTEAMEQRLERIEHQDELIEHFTPVFKAKPRDEWCRLLEAAEVPMCRSRWPPECRGCGPSPTRRG